METSVNIRMNKELKKSLEKLAEQDHRKLSDFIRLQLERLVEPVKYKK